VGRIIGKVEESFPLLKAFEELRHALLCCVIEGESDMMDIFINDPYDFIMDYAKDKKLRGFEPALFTVSCRICHKPIILTQV